MVTATAAGNGSHRRSSAQIYACTSHPTWDYATPGKRKIEGTRAATPLYDLGQNHIEGLAAGHQRGIGVGYRARRPRLHGGVHGMAGLAGLEPAMPPATSGWCSRLWQRACCVRLRPHNEVYRERAAQIQTPYGAAGNPADRRQVTELDRQPLPGYSAPQPSIRLGRTDQGR